MRMNIRTIATIISCVIICVYLIKMARHSKWRNNKAKTLKDLRSSSERVKSTCRALHGTDQNMTVSAVAIDYGTILVDHYHKLIYCLIPKVASSNVRRLFLVLGKHVQNTDPASITSQEVNAYTNDRTLVTLASMSKTDSEHYLKSYTKVMFTRGIFERLISAYHSKIEIGGDEHSRVMKKDIVESLKMESTLPLDNIAVSFADFIRYILYLKDSNQTFYQHWATIEDLCDPCHVHYDYIGEFENLGKQMDAILEAVGVDRSIRFPTREATKYDPVTMATDRLKTYYKDVPYDYIRQLQDLYFRDMMIYADGIPWPLRLLYHKELLKDGVALV